MTTSSNTSSALPRVVVITCAVLEEEVRHYGKETPNLVHILVMEQGLHNEPAKLREELQKAVDQVEATIPCDIIVLGYGLCSRGVEGVITRKVKLVIPRAHDCITVLLGSKERYAAYVKEHPGTYWYSPGWNKHHTPPGKDRYDKLRQKYVEQYGADNADFLMEEEQKWFKTYQRAAYVDLTVGATEADLRYTQDCAQWLGWEYDHQKGDAGLLCRLLAGEINPAQMLLLEPGQTLEMTADDMVMRAIPALDPSRPH